MAYFEQKEYLKSLIALTHILKDIVALMTAPESKRLRIINVKIIKLNHF